MLIQRSTTLVNKCSCHRECVKQLTIIVFFWFDFATGYTIRVIHKPSNTFAKSFRRTGKPQHQTLFWERILHSYCMNRPTFVELDYTMCHWHSENLLKVHYSPISAARLMKISMDLLQKIFQEFCILLYVFPGRHLSISHLWTTTNRAWRIRNIVPTYVKWS